MEMQPSLNPPSTKVIQMEKRMSCLNVWFSLSNTIDGDGPIVACLASIELQIRSQHHRLRPSLLHVSPHLLKLKSIVRATRVWLIGTCSGETGIVTSTNNLIRNDLNDLFYGSGSVRSDKDKAWNGKGVEDLSDNGGFTKVCYLYLIRITS